MKHPSHMPKPSSMNEFVRGIVEDKPLMRAVLVTALSLGAAVSIDIHKALSRKDDAESQKQSVPAQDAPTMRILPSSSVEVITDNVPKEELESGS